MFDIPFHINLVISLVEVEHPLKTSNKRTHITLPIYFLIEVGHPLKVSLHTYNFCYNWNYRGIITDYKCVSSTYNFLLFSIICGLHLAIVSL